MRKPDGSPAAFAALGDHAVATQCLRVAGELAAANRKGS